MPNKYKEMFFFLPFSLFFALFTVFFPLFAVFFALWQFWSKNKYLQKCRSKIYSFLCDPNFLQHQIRKGLVLVDQNRRILVAMEGLSMTGLHTGLRILGELYPTHTGRNWRTLKYRNHNLKLTSMTVTWNQRILGKRYPTHTGRNGRT